jgi:hypothetical protein
MKPNENERSNQSSVKQQDGINKEANTERGQGNSGGSTGTGRDHTLRPEAGSQKSTQGNGSELKQSGTDVRDTSENKEGMTGNESSKKSGEDSGKSTF